MKICKQMKTQMQSQSGFTFLEILISITIFSVAILGLMTTSHTVGMSQRSADDMTEATMIASDQMENIKRLATNEPLGGAFGFSYLLDSAGFLTGYSSPDDFTRTRAETTSEDPDLPPGITRTTTLTVYPAAAQATEDFTQPDTIHMVEVQVNVTWVNASGATKKIPLSTVLQRRQFIQ
jgi:prepilin-type N-terminal cleavage/methylation domain-containing protein